MKRAFLMCVLAGAVSLPAVQDRSSTTPVLAPCSRVHIFYYDWYGAPGKDRGYRHWQQGGHTPPDDIGSNFYPLLGAYSSSDAEVLKQHMRWIREAGAGVLTLTWWGRGSGEDRRTKLVLDAADTAGLKVNFHIEPYPGRTPSKVARDIEYILSQYGHHPAFYRAGLLGGRPMFYIFETVRSSAREWKEMNARVHAAPEPVIVIAQTASLDFVRDGGFDGGYTYDGLAPFRVPGFVERWPETVRRFAEAGKIFIPSVGPGYWDDRATRNGGADEPEAARTRDAGKATTYAGAWLSAIRAQAQIVTVTSFNEWHEGSQIEPAVEHRANRYLYPPYAGGPTEYLRRTGTEVRKFPACSEPEKK